MMTSNELTSIYRDWKYSASPQETKRIVHRLFNLIVRMGVFAAHYPMIHAVATWVPLFPRWGQLAIAGTLIYQVESRFSNILTGGAAMAVGALIFREVSLDILWRASRRVYWTVRNGKMPDFTTQAVAWRVAKITGGFVQSVGSALLAYSIAASGFITQKEQMPGFGFDTEPRWFDGKIIDLTYGVVSFAFRILRYGRENPDSVIMRSCEKFLSENLVSSRRNLSTG
jgi:hypothetical protein